MKIIILILLSGIVYSCGNRKQPIPPPSIPKANIIAVWTRADSVKELGVFVRSIEDRPKTDSTTGKKYVLTDTFWYKEIIVGLVDKDGKPVLDSLGKPKPDPTHRYIPINKDSINTKVENIPVDSLIKKVNP